MPVLAMTDDGLVQINDEFIPSPVIDAVFPTDYAYVAATDSTRFVVQEIGINGGINSHGPFDLGNGYGAHFIPWI